MLTTPINKWFERRLEQAAMRFVQVMAFLTIIAWMFDNDDK